MSKSTRLLLHYRFFILLLCSLAIVRVGFSKSNETTSKEIISPPGVRFSGKVLDSLTREGLPGATVLVEELKKGVHTKLDGSFVIEDLPRGRYWITVRSISYEPKRVQINLVTNLEETILLVPAKVLKQEATVIGEVTTPLESESTGQPIAVLDPKQLDKERGQTIGESLKEVPGVTVLQTGPGVSKPVIRGLHSQRLLVLNYGVAQEGQQWGAEHAPEIDAYAANRIVVLKGVSTVEYGPSAFGGVIKIEPREMPKEPKVNGEFDLNLFSNNRQGSGSLLVQGGMPGVDRLTWRVQGSTRKAGDAVTPDYIIRNTGFEELNGSATLGYKTERSNFILYASHFGSKLGIYKGAHIGNLTDLKNAFERGQPLSKDTFSYSIDPPSQDVNHNLLSFASDLSILPLGRLSIQYGLQQNTRQEFDAHTTRFVGNQPGEELKPAFDLTLTTQTLDVKLHHEPLGNFFGTVGISGMRQGNVGAGVSQLIPNYRQYTGGIYAIERYFLGDFDLSAGLRSDYESLQVYSSGKVTSDRLHTFSTLAAAVGISYEPHSSWSISANVATGSRAPTVNELYSNGVHHGTAQYETGDPNLGAERSINADLTLKYQDKRFNAEASIYQNTINDFIYLYPLPDPVLTIRGAFPAFEYRHTDARLRGVEATLEYQLLDFLHLSVSAAIVRGDNLNTSEPLIYMPSDRYRAMMHFELPEFGTTITNSHLELASTIVDRQDRVPANSDYVQPPPGYTLFDVAWNFDLHAFQDPFSVSLEVQNLLDTRYRDYLSRYRYFIDDPGRNIILRFRIPFNGFDESE